MNARMRQSLDEYITGHWGEDQFRNEQDLTAHEEYVMLMGLPVYDYDPAEDGPECEVITSIRINHPHLVIGGRR